MVPIEQLQKGYLKADPTKKDAALGENQVGIVFHLCNRKPGCKKVQYAVANKQSDTRNQEIGEGRMLQNGNGGTHSGTGRVGDETVSGGQGPDSGQDHERNG